MKRHVKKVAVLGSGVMGSAIAAHFANAGIRSLVLDIVPRELTAEERAAGLSLDHPRVRNRIAAMSVKALAKARPAALFSAWRGELIEIGNLEDDLPRLAEADWVIEVVREDMEIKKKVLAAVAPHLAPDAVLTSNTSGLPLGEMARALPEALRPRFLGTHFFNPPRYMKLLELIPTEYTDPDLAERVGRFCNDRLGKGIVPAKDTPNFIANRIGVHAFLVCFRVMQEMKLSPEELDTLTGPPLARPKTATLRLADLVGLDTLLFVARNVYELTPDDESRDGFQPPGFLTKMVEKGLLGRKTGAGFYKKEKKDVLTLDLDKLEYRPAVPPNLPELKALKGLDDPRRRVRTLVGGEGRAAEAAWRILSPSLAYAAMRLGEIADDAATIDRALRWGFNWELGPFEIWDALGFRETVERMRADGLALPAWVDALYEAGGDAIYRERDGVVESPTAQAGRSAAVARDERVVDFDSIRRSGGEVRRNDSASLLDLGDGVLALEFHSKMNAIDEAIVEMMHAAADEAERNWQAIVVANWGTNFCAGANLMLLAQYGQAGDWKAIRGMVHAFQSATNRLEQCAVPVVTAPHGMALGGGCEVAMAGNAMRPAAEVYIGLVEVGAGLIPAGGGCLRLYKRNVALLPDARDVYPALRKTFETIGQAKVSSSAEEARELGFMRLQDGWSMNRDHLVADAKEIALAMARAGYTPPLPEQRLTVMGRSGIALIETALINMVEGRFISPHDQKIGRELALILCGGDVPGPTQVSEQHLLELECESFLRLCGERKTHERIEALLKTGKPLRN